MSYNNNNVKNWSTEEEAYLAENVGNERQALMTAHHPAENIFVLTAFCQPDFYKKKSLSFKTQRSSHFQSWERRGLGGQALKRGGWRTIYKYHLLGQPGLFSFKSSLVIYMQDEHKGMLVTKGASAWKRAVPGSRYSELGRQRKHSSVKVRAA